MNNNKSNVVPVGTGVISDGRINETNLSRLSLDKKWLEQQLQEAGVKDISEVFYAEVGQDGTLYVDKKSDTVH